MQTPINLLFRKKLGQFNSIEEIFNALIPEVQKHRSITKIEVPCSGAKLKDILYNIQFVSKLKGIHHISGHINYLAPFLGKNTVLTVHDVNSNVYGNVIKRFILKLFWLWLPALFVKRITVISEFSKRELTQVVPFAKHKIIVIPNPIKKELIHKPKTFNTEYPTLLHIGTKPNKNLERTIIAIKDIPCQLVIIGKLSTEQENLLKENKIDYLNKYHIPYTEIIDAYQQCDILCFASTYEGFGMPIIEAQAIGRPVLTSKVAAMPEVANGSAHLINPHNTHEITSGIQKIITSANYRENLIKKGLENVKRFNIETIAKQYVAVYNK